MAFSPEFERLVLESIPFHRWLGLKIMGGSFADPRCEGWAHAELPFRDELVGDPRRPALHGGVIATLLDACGGYAAWSTLTAEDKVSTIDLRTDYLSPAGAEPLLAEANVVRMGNRVAVVDIRCWQASRPDAMCATGKGVYNIRRSGRVNVRVTLTDRGSARVRGGLPWVYASDVQGADGDGETCTLVDRRGTQLGFALWSKASPIPVRVVGPEAVELDEAFFRTRVAAAIARRAADGSGAGPESAARLVHAEADGLPGLVVDRYADVVVLQSLAPAIDRREAMIAAILEELTHARLVVARDDGSARDLDALPRRKGVLRGGGTTTVAYRDAGSLVEVDVLGDGKTGGYLDQLANHAVAARYAAGECLDAFTYHGGFALALCKGGATSVLALDESAAATERARANGARNGYGQLRVETANAFDRLRQLEGAGKTFRTVVVDPPALAKRRGRGVGGAGKEGMEPALRAYKELNLRALRLLEPGGVLITCSCSGRVTASIFGDVLEAAARDAGRTVQVLERRGAGADHPVLLGVPETEYLKAFVLRVLR